MGLKKYRISDGAGFRLKDHDPGDTGKFESKEQGQVRLVQGIARLRELQDRLFAQDRWAVLLIFQAMDAAGKDSTIAHVMSGVNPQGTQVFAFKAPSAEELDHDFMWRTNRSLPERGRIGIFNRSYYEEVLIVRVHPGILAGQKLPAGLVGDGIWKQRFEDINAFERYLSRNGTRILKFFLHVSREEQRKRFLARLDDPSKNWKFALGDVKEREHWDDYMKAYEDMIANTSTEQAPWHVIPADHKWFVRMVVADAIVEALEGLKLEYPEIDEEKKKELQAARDLLIKQ
jgi:PPK2 family polyphosphate:nucleotide phosphotransferase